PDPGTTYSYFPYVDGVVYWNEDMAMFSNDLHALDPYGHPDSELVENVNLVGWTQDVDGSGDIELLPEVMSYRTIGLSTMTNITIDESSNVFLAYASTTETYDNGTYNFKHIWARGIPDGGVWGDFLDLDDDLVHIFDECIYPNWSPNSDNNVYLIYQIDTDPGLALDDDHPYHDNSVLFVDLEKSEIIPIGSREKEANNVRVSQNYPNPFTGSTASYFMMDEPTVASINVVNIVGQTVC
ncbi:MAG: hypothetical protein K8R53_12220, partial [Bacteroidales bacterium]|nr:hypothetical protein [Bacteroidales bacterium]